MEAIQDVFNRIQSKNPKIAQHLKDAKESLASKKIESLTTPSDKCPLKKCDGSGFLWMVNYEKKLNPDYFVDELERHQQLYKQALEAKEQDEVEIQRIRTIIADLRSPAEWWDPCECHKQLEAKKLAEKRLDLSGIPECFRKAKVLGFKVDCYKKPTEREKAELARLAAINYIENFATFEEQGKGLYFTSRVKGSGKTRLASSIANSLINVHAKQVIFIKAADISAQVRKTYNKDSDTSEIEVLQAFYDAEVLVIDDLAVENNSTSFVEELLSKILDHRMDKRKITIVTSNRPISELDRKPLYTKGIVKSRIQKMCIEIDMPEESVREEEANKENEVLDQILFRRKEGA